MSQPLRPMARAEATQKSRSAGGRRKLKATLDDLGEALASARHDARTHVGDGLVTVDARATIVDCDSAAERLFGLSRRRLLGCDLSELVRPAAGRERRAGLERFLPVGGLRLPSQHLRLVGLRAHSSEFAAEVSIERLQARTPPTYAAHVSELGGSESALRRSRAQLEVILDGIADGVLARDMQGRTVYANEAAVRLLGFPSPLSALETPIDRIPQWLELRNESGEIVPLEALPGHRAMLGESPPDTLFDMRVRTTGEQHWALVKARPIHDPRGRVALVILIFEDITEHKQREQEQRFLADTGEILTASLDLDAIVKQVVQLAVPELADWCVLDMVAEDGSIRRVDVAHADPSKRAMAEQVKQIRLEQFKGGTVEAIRTGKSLLYRELTESTRAQLTQDDAHLDLMRQAGVSSNITVPLRAHGRILGALALTNAESKRQFDDSDLKLAEDLARRCAIAIDNARLYRSNQQALALLDTLFTKAPIGLGYWDRDLRYLRVNERLAAISGLAAADHIGRRGPELLPAASAKTEAIFKHVLASGEPVIDDELTGESAADPGKKRNWVASYYPVRNTAGETLGVGGVVLDVTEQREAAERVAHLAYHDSLTGLANRALLEEHLQLALARARREGRSVALLYLDLNDFKLVNDSLGHVAGDELLRKVGQRLEQATRATDLVARPGGDEFLLLLPDIEADPATAAAAVAQSIATALQSPVVIADTELQLGVSVGISTYPQDAGDAISLLKHADAAMYEAKRSGRNNVSVYAGRSTDPLDQLALPARLRRALARDEFVLHYQPIFDLASGKIEAVEALIRWQDPKRGLVKPAEFIPIAEHGLIEPIGEWVFRTICRQARQWLDAGLAPRINFNLSPRELHRHERLTLMRDQLAACTLHPAMFSVEITESVAMQELESVDALLYEFEALGFGLVIDDFGTGYSSLARLRQMRVQTLKIDPSFLHDVPQKPDAVTLVAAIIQLAQSLGMRAIAEGVETEAQREFLIEHGCPLAQGFHLGEPLTAEQATTLLEIDQAR